MCWWVTAAAWLWFLGGICTSCQLAYHSLIATTFFYSRLAAKPGGLHPGIPPGASGGSCLYEDTPGLACVPGPTLPASWQDLSGSIILHQIAMQSVRLQTGSTQLVPAPYTRSAISRFLPEHQWLLPISSTWLHLNHIHWQLYYICEGS